MRIGNKLVVNYTLLAIFTFLVTGVILRSSIGFFYTENLSQRVIAQANAVGVAINELGANDLGGAQTKNLVEKLGRATDTRITLIDAEGDVLADSQAVNPGMMPNHANIAEVKEALSGEIGKSTRFSNIIKENVLYVAVPFEDDGRFKGAIRIALPMSEIDNALDRFGLIILAIAMLASVLVVGTSFVLSNSLTRPLKQMMVLAERMAHDDLDQRLPTERKDEIGELSGSLNYLAEKLKDRIGELKSEKAKAELILDSMVEGILLLNKDGAVILTNPSIERIFGVTSGDVIGNPVATSIGNPDLDRAVGEAASSGKEVVEELELQEPYKRLRVRVLPVKGSADENRALAVIRDITREKQIERVRKDFIANVSHELKTPLTGLKLLSESLLRSVDTDPVITKRFILRLDKEINTLIHMVRELIDLSRLETPQDSVEKAPVDLRALVHEVGSSFEGIAASKRLTLEVTSEQDIPPIFADRDQLLTLARNLIDNAIRYTPAGGNIRVKLKEDDGHIGLIVKDSGIGLAQRDIPRIFERFYRVDKARSRETGGTGLGLSIVKHIAENHDATVDVESRLGIGSKFTVRFPVS